MNYIKAYYTPALRAIIGDRDISPRGGDVGYDLYTTHDLVIAVQSNGLALTGLHLQLPEGLYARVEDRSSMALAGFITMGGIIDPAYRGEIAVMLYNTSYAAQTLEAGRRIAQLVISPYATPPIRVVGTGDLNSTIRGNNGFGSTGK